MHKDLYAISQEFCGLIMFCVRNRPKWKFLKIFFEREVVMSHLRTNHSLKSVQLIQFTKDLWMIHWLIELIQLTDSMIKSQWKLSVNTAVNFNLFLTQNLTQVVWITFMVFFGYFYFKAWNLQCDLYRSSHCLFSGWGFWTIHGWIRARQSGN